MDEAKSLVEKMEEASANLYELYFVRSPAEVGVILPAARLALLESIEMAKDLERRLDSLQSRVELLESQLEINRGNIN